MLLTLWIFVRLEWISLLLHPGIRAHQDSVILVDPSPLLFVRVALVLHPPTVVEVVEIPLQLGSLLGAHLIIGDVLEHVLGAKPVLARVNRADAEVEPAGALDGGEVVALRLGEEIVELTRLLLDLALPSGEAVVGGLAGTAQETDDLLFHLTDELQII